MGTIADKLLYLDGTKTALRDAINQAGGYLTTADPFRDYVDDWLRSQSATLSLEFWCERFLTRRRGGMAENALGFANIITFTRASSGGVFNEYGQYVSLATNVWRPDHDPASVTTSTSTVAFDSLTATFTLPSGHAFQVGDKFRATAVAGSLWGVVVARTDTTATVHARNSTTTGSASSWTCIKPRGILIEEQRTNLNTYSEQINSANYDTTTFPSTLVANAAISPSGLADASLLSPTTSSTAHAIFRTGAQHSYTSGTAYSASIYAKNVGGRYLQLTLPSAAFGASQYANFDLQNGVLGTVAGGTAAITPVGNGWFRCAFSASATATAAGAPGSIVIVPSATSGRVAGFVGVPENGIYIWGAQLEAGAFPTSYIPTVASQVTRSADVASVNTLSPWYNASEGTLFVEWATNFDIGDKGGIFAINDGTVDNNMNARQFTSRTTRVSVINGGAAQAVSNGSSIPLGAVARGALSYGVNNFAWADQGAVRWTDTLGLVPTVTTLRIGSNVPTTGNQLNGHISNISYYPRAYSGIVLQEMT